MSGPLAGVRVVDLTAVFLGPVASQTLGDLGADVIKIETPDGDITRSITPARNRGMGTGFLAVNRNKRSVVLDLKQAEARAVLGRLIAGADVLMHSMRPQAMDRLGFGPAAARAINPRIIHCAAYGYRRDGPHGWRPAYDDVIQAASGLAAIQASFAGEPRYVPTSMIDKLVGLTVAQAIGMALFHRERSGEGQAIEIPMYETTVAFLMPEHMAGRGFAPPEGPAGYGRVLAPHRRPYRTADGHIGVLPYTVTQWQRLFELIGRPEMAADPRVTDGPTRNRHVGALYEMVADAMPARTTADWHRAFDAADIPAMPVQDLDAVLDCPHLAATGFYETHHHDSEGDIVLLGHPVRYERTPAEISRLPPRLGQHTVEVLAEAGYDAAEIESLLVAGAAVGEPQE
ncbi:crotonobetainyl-CoA:carnitine CoA-transferase CaiB-like acyl-CoA transferase [Stella humosa]|uniref:Crotonobetainyl-CoA:carnitine CoA-transferase CaiB-like acyl-CoA transferase n=1 Tax=Stella humosa TaxID=94 RepID=A0A3N1KQZ5_9PROT|nr:CoA transferase [Stella humosa]ROP81219.1 crotonobetainyl-CoA:carnitine CoA-transferase CaiB-like acyl-CoA transferase [Stella humosa]BBK32566.1 CoA transferase [Stella humosa]